MRSIKTDKKLKNIEERILYHSKEFNRNIPEIRFFILDSWEFISLLEKNVYPFSPSSMWEGKEVINEKFRKREGLDPVIYYEVVQTGNPSYAYLNETNSEMMQASVMSHVIGHCNFSALSVLNDMEKNRTEYIMYLTKKINLCKNQMGEKSYFNYWNACESIKDFAFPNSSYNLKNSIETDEDLSENFEEEKEESKENKELFQPYSSTLDSMLKPLMSEKIIKDDIDKKEKNQEISRRGYKLKAPCQDILGFLKLYSPMSKTEKYILQYIYEVYRHHDFIRKTQIMNEGWATYWQKKIMMELFKEKTVNGVIDHCKKLSWVCYPRPYFQRNPYHLGYNLWNHIEELYKEGKVDLEYFEEKDVEKKINWKRADTKIDPLKKMEELIKTITDHEFIRRFLSDNLIEKFHLNKIDKRYISGFDPDILVKEEKKYIWIDPKFVKKRMLNFFIDFNHPRIYIINTNFEDGGLLLYHRTDERELKKDWIPKTLKNISCIWKNSVSILTDKELWTYSNGKNIVTDLCRKIEFDEIKDKIEKNKKFLDNKDISNTKKYGAKYH